jgi:hypothetical protein
MSIFGKLFNSEKAIDNISRGVDKAIYTNEEKADFFAKLLELYAPFKLAQRYLALIFCIPYALTWVVVSLCYVAIFIAGFYYPNTQPMLENILPILQHLNGDYGTICITIVVFYFGGGALEGAVERFKGVKK